MEGPCSPGASGPYVLLIEEAAPHALSAETLLREAGFVVERLPAPGIAEQRASTLLDPTRPGPALLILCDMHPPWSSPARPGSLEGGELFDATFFAAALLEAMERGRLRPAPFAMTSAELSREREARTRLAGCGAMLGKPLRAKDARLLRRLCDLPQIPGASTAFRGPAGAHEPDGVRMLLRHAAQQPRALRARPAPGRSASLPPATIPGQPLAWDRRLVSLLLTNPLQLLRTEPAASHFRVYGGAQAIIELRASLRALPLPAAQLRLLECLLARLERVSVEHLLPELNISRRTYHRQLDLLVRIAECELNRGLVQAHAQPRPAAPLDGASGSGR